MEVKQLITENHHHCQCLAGWVEKVAEEVPCPPVGLLRTVGKCSQENHLDHSTWKFLVDFAHIYRGQLCVLPSLPIYQRSTQDSHPRIFLQQRVYITGAVIGDL